MKFHFNKILIIDILVVSIFSSIILIGNHNLIKSEGQCYSAESNSILRRSVINFQENSFKSFSQNFQIFGYKLDPEADVSINTDYDGVLTITQNKLNFVDIILNLKSGFYIYEDMPISGIQYINSNKETTFSYEIEDPLRNFFLDMFIGTKLIYIDLAFIGDNYELIYEGVDSIEQDEFNYIFTQKVEVLNSDINLKVEQIFDSYSDTEESSLSETIEIMKKQQLDNIRIYQNDQKNNIQTLEISITNYGIAHEVVVSSYVNLPPNLPDSYWEPYSEIDIGIYRYKPSENVIQADLQYYNMDYLSPKRAWKRNIKAYTIYTHGDPSWNTAWAMKSYNTYLYPSEVEDLWYHKEIGLENWGVYPNDMIILASVCFGYYGDDEIPYMAEAFVDYGGTAFVGSTLPIPTLHNDDFSGEFWTSLCQDDDTIEDATIAYINEHNEYVGEYGWYGGYNLDIYWYYDLNVRVYGNENGRLDN